MYNNSNPLRVNVVALWPQAGLRKFAYRKLFGFLLALTTTMLLTACGMVQMRL